jgi:hypothetical protein
MQIGGGFDYFGLCLLAFKQIGEAAVDDTALLVVAI